MLFNSIEFLIFFILVFFIFYYLNGRYRKIFLLIASCIFYMRFIPSYIFILFVTILIDYIAAIKIEKSNDKKKKKILLILGIVNTCLVLFIFKYFDFFIDNLNYLYGYIHLPLLRHMGIILPIGLSFHTFQSLSYVIEVYRGNIKAERNLLNYSVFVMMFPQLVAGPIERAKNILPQLKKCDHTINYADFSIGLSRFFWGLFKKVVIADTAAIYVNSVYNNIEFHNGSTLLVATLLFSIQIYCDFSGYSDMAIGIAQMLGFRFKENFTLPYFSKDVTEFWRRWHISLSSWFRDYLFLPISYRISARLKKEKYFFIKTDYIIYIGATLITFLLCGLWHGASWNFVIWGGLNGLLLSVELFYIKKRKRNYHFLIKLLRISYMFIAISLTWIFFRAYSFTQSITIYKKIFFHFNISSFQLLNSNIFVTIVLSIFILIGTEYFFLRKSTFSNLFNKKYGEVKTTFITIMMIFFIILFGNSEGSQFIYFQF